MNRFFFPLITLLFVACNPRTDVAQKPNIVFILADDFTYTAINALGNPEIITPNLDNLVKQGTTFTHAFNMGGWNGAICTASRAMIISGRSLWDANAFRQRWIYGDGYDKTWGKLMEKAGYETFMTGKWHVDAPVDSIFQTVRNSRPGMPGDARNHGGHIEKLNLLIKKGVPDTEIRNIGYNRPIPQNDTLWHASDQGFGGFWQGGKHWTEVLKDDALGFIEQTVKSEEPFFMYLAFNAPHDPRQSPQEFLDKYPMANISVPKNFLSVYPFKDSIGNGVDLRDEALAPFPRTEYAVKTHLREYYALITHLDEQIGKIVNALEASGKLAKTYIIFTADHGLAVGSHGLMGKQSQFDHSIRAPFIIVGPKIAKGKKIDADIYIQDAMATSLDLADIEKPNYVFYNSVLDLTNGSRIDSHYDAIYGAYTNLQRMIRKDGYKLIVYPKLDKVLLFDLAKDPEEMCDLAESSGHKDKLHLLLKVLLEKQKVINDHLDLNPLYQKITSN